VTFGHPLLLLSLLLVPLAIGLFLLARRRRMRYALTFTNLDLLASVVGSQRSWRRYVAPALFLLSLAALCVAVARPYRHTLVPQEKATVILVVDISGSMQARDVKPTRLIAAEEAVRTFLDRAPKSLRVGLIGFSGEPFVAAPPTTDHELVEQSLRELTFPDLYTFGGTAIGDALARAVEMARAAVPEQPETIAYSAARASGGLASILFLSDGHQTRGALEPLEGAERARAARIPVYTVALGTPNGVIVRRNWYGGPRRIAVPPDPETLSAIARVTGGKFFAARSADTLTSAYRDLGSELGRIPGKREVTWLLLAVAAALLAAAGVASALWAPRIP
jgi:Ca-activated chloride channel homolog